ncbi:MAG: YggS family pyridoxal phosphate-dependent enzyme [Gemmatimonadota bacterium]|jgi:pyridoxal phosphate enzyme (YggS family)
MYDARIRETLPRVRERIARALERAGRPDEVELVAVTKGHPLDAVRAAVAAGLGVLGENRVQELDEKVAAVGRTYAEWHLIGHLQRNKVRRSLALFDRIHSIDSLRLARTLSAEAGRTEREVRGYVQVNVSGEETKGGFEGAEVVDALGVIVELPWLHVDGLMTMAPLTDDAGTLHKTFGAARRLLEEAKRQFPVVGGGLSMGMSNDFEIALEEGATILRLGTVLFGERRT